MWPARAFFRHGHLEQQGADSDLGHLRFLNGMDVRLGQQEICMKERIDRHKDGSIKAKGHMRDGELEGYWEWFRKDGSKMRSGYFADGKQEGEWTTYDTKGKVVKVTKFSR